MGYNCLLRDLLKIRNNAKKYLAYSRHANGFLLSSLEMLLWFGYEMSPPGSCLNSWFPAGDTAWEGFETFRRQSIPAGSLSLEVGFEVLLSGLTPCSFSQLPG